MSTPKPSGICTADTSNIYQTHKWNDMMGEIVCPYCTLTYDEWWDVTSDYWQEKGKWAPEPDKESR